ncbi:MAG: hypothetical protein U0354_02130 [Candidatus Sericytochromatia bacterium]
MKKILALVLFSFIISSPVFAKDEEKKKEEKTPIFDNMEDRTQKLNQEYSNNLIYSPFNSPFAQSRFVPDIALITDFSYAYRNFTNDNLKNIKSKGFVNNGQSDLPIFNSRNGFNFNYAELSLGSSVDPYFDMFTNFHLAEFGFEIEEAFVNTRTLPYGFQIKAGKFFSSFGRINSQHSHYWDFSDSPAIYSNFLGEHNLLEKGVQINWLAPTELYILSGVEVFSGENEKSFGNRGFTSGTNKLENVNYPSLFTGFIKTSIDFDDLILLGGLSIAQGGSRVISEEESTNSGMHIHALDPNIKTNFAGSTRLIGLDLTAKYFFDSYRYLSLQSEFLQRAMTGSEYTDSSRISTNREQSGFYSQLIWKFNQQWRVGGRFDLITQNQIIQDNKNLNLEQFLPKYTAMLDFNPTEFSRIRLQFNHDRTKFLDNTQIGLNEVFLQLNMSIGAHGAHSF